MTGEECAPAKGEADPSPLKGIRDDGGRRGEGDSNSKRGPSARLRMIAKAGAERPQGQNADLSYTKGVRCEYGLAPEAARRS
jgi:hypothetical protein